MLLAPGTQVQAVVTVYRPGVDVELSELHDRTVSNVGHEFTITSTMANYSRFARQEVIRRFGVESTYYYVTLIDESVDEF